jgi:hypothetical protein
MLSLHVRMLDVNPDSSAWRSARAGRHRPSKFAHRLRWPGTLAFIACHLRGNGLSRGISPVNLR